MDHYPHEKKSREMYVFGLPTQAHHPWMEGWVHSLLGSSVATERCYEDQTSYQRRNFENRIALFFYKEILT